MVSPRRTILPTRNASPRCFIELFSRVLHRCFASYVVFWNSSIFLQRHKYSAVKTCFNTDTQPPATPAGGHLPPLLAGDGRREQWWRGNKSDTPTSYMSEISLDYESFFKYSPHLLTRRFFAFASMTRRYVNANHYEGAQHKSKSKEKKNSVCCYVACYWFLLWLRDKQSVHSKHYLTKRRQDRYNNII